MVLREKETVHLAILGQEERRKEHWLNCSRVLGTKSLGKLQEQDKWDRQGWKEEECLSTFPWKHGHLPPQEPCVTVSGVNVAKAAPNGCPDATHKSLY